MKDRLLPYETIVKAHDGDIVRDLKPLFVDGFERADRHLIIAGEDRVGTLGH